MEIVDGDTIRVMIDGKLYPVRYIGMDTPETAFGQEQYGDEAAQKNADLALGKDVVLIKDVSETDEFDRLLRYVFAGDVFVNYELLVQGYATVATYPPDVACSGLFLEAQAYARDNLLGMWAPQAAITLRGPVYIDKPLQILVVNKKAEYLDLINVSNALVDLTGWYIISERGDQRCDLSGTIPAGGKLRVYTMEPQGPGITCGFSNPMWSNDDPDAAILYDLYDREIDRYE